MNPPRLPIQRLMFWVAVVAVNLALFRALFTTRRLDILLVGALSWVVLQVVASRAARKDGPGRAYRLGFAAGGAVALLTLISASSFPRSIVGKVWAGYASSAEGPIYNSRVLDALERSVGGESTELALLLYEMAVEFLPLLLSALAAGLLARRIQARFGRSVGPEGPPLTSARPSSSPASP